jgi:peptide deformylase
MAVRAIVEYPHRSLKRPARPIGTVTGRDRRLARDLVDTMRAAPACVGLAAPQIGVDRRAFCVDVRGHRHTTSHSGLVVLFDPEILDSEGTEVRREGCLSVPHLTADVARAARLTVAGTDPQGSRRTVHAEGFEARAILHEIDHLDGRLILDRATGPSSLFPRKVYR